MSCSTDFSVEVEQGITYRITIQDGTEAEVDDVGAIARDDGEGYIIPTDWDSATGAEWKFWSREDTPSDFTLTDDDGVEFDDNGRINLTISVENGRKIPICKSSGDADYGPHSRLTVTYNTGDTDKIFDVCLNVQGEDQ